MRWARLQIELTARRALAIPDVDAALGGGDVVVRQAEAVRLWSAQHAAGLGSRALRQRLSLLPGSGHKDAGQAP